MTERSDRPQSLAVLPESLLGTQDPVFGMSNKSTSDAPWIETFNEYSQYLEDNPMQPTLHAAKAIVKRVLSDERLIQQAKPILGNVRAAKAFNRLIGHQQSQSELLQGYLNDGARSKYSLITPKERLLADIFGEKLGELTDFSSIFLDTETPNAVRIELIRLHNEALLEAANHLQTEAPALLEDYDTALGAAIDSGWLPKTAVESYHKVYRHQSMELAVSDPTINIQMDRGGHWDAVANVCYIDADRVFDPEKLKRTAFHELTHERSGHTLIGDVSDQWLIEEEGSFPDISEYHIDYIDLTATRVGLRSGYVTDFNEAVTEFIAMSLSDRGYQHHDLWERFEQLLGEEDETHRDKLIEGLSHTFGPSYLYERIMLAGLITAGVDEQLFFAAYFESYEPRRNRTKVNDKKAHRFILDEAIQEVTGVKSLRMLSTYLQQEAIKITQSDDPESSKYSDFYRKFQKVAVLHRLINDRTTV